MIYFTLPNFFDNAKLNDVFSQLLTSNPEYFSYKNLAFSYADGSLPYFYWSLSNYNNYPRHIIPTRADIANLLRHPLRLNLDCGNPLLVPNDLFDIRINAFLEELHNGSNMVTISTPMLIEFFETNYPYYYLVGSEIFYKQDPEKLHLDKLKFIRQNSMDLNNPYYKDIPKSKIELCIGSPCFNCEDYEKCLQTDSLNRLMFSEKSVILECPRKNLKILSPEEVMSFVKQGYTHFYLDIKGINLNDYKTVISIYLQTFVKSEYHNTVGSILEGVYLNG